MRHERVDLEAFDVSRCFRLVDVGGTVIVMTRGWTRRIGGWAAALVIALSLASAACSPDGGDPRTPAATASPAASPTIASPTPAITPVAALAERATAPGPYAVGVTTIELP